MATETFFETAVHLKRKHESLYNLLKDYHRQDPEKRERMAARMH